MLSLFLGFDSREPNYVEYGIAFVLLLCALYKQFGKKTEDGYTLSSFWWPVIASCFGLIMKPAWWTIGFGDGSVGFYRSVLSDFFLVFAFLCFLFAGVAALIGKRILGVISSILLAVSVFSVMTMRAFFILDYDGYVSIDYFAVLATVLLIATVIWQYKIHKSFPKVIWIVLILLCVPYSFVRDFLSGVDPEFMSISYFRFNLTLVATILWLSPARERKIKLPKIEFAKLNSGSAKTKVSPADTADKLKALETLQGLLNNGAITQEEFDAKKKQLLGL